MRRALYFALIAWTGGVLVLPSPAWAVPSFARRYGVSCSTCHDAWPHLNGTGWAFKMSGYRRLNGRDVEPTQKDIEMALGALEIPSIPPLAVIGSVGFDHRQDKRTASDGTRSDQTGSSLNMENVNLFVATPLGKHLSFFAEFPMFETHAIENDGPTGPGEANKTTGADAHRAIQFETESPTFELGKVMWNSVLPVSLAPLDSLNIVAGVDQLPVAFSPEANRLSVTPYPIYRRRAVDLLSPTSTADLLAGNEADRLLRIGEPQILLELNGLLVLGGPLTDMSKPSTPILEYHVGMTNGSNINADANTQKDVYSRLALRWYGQVLGFFGYWSPDIYDDAQRTDGSIGGAPAGISGIFSGRHLANRFSSVGPDLLLSLEPFDIPVWLETQILFNRESDPTGFKKSFEWWGGFTQLYVKPIKSVVVYTRYDGLWGKRFDDTVNDGVTGPVRPREWDVVVGVQWYVLENLKVGPEFSHREYRNNVSTPSHQKVEENFVTVRATLGF